MKRQFDKELSDVVSQMELVRRSCVSSLLFLNKGEEQISEMHFVTFLNDLKELNTKVSDLKRHMSEGD